MKPMLIAIVVSQFHKKISSRLLAGAKKAMAEAGLPAKNVPMFEVPGAFEIPWMAQKIIAEKKCSGVIALGAVLKGETAHYRAVCDGVTYGIQKVAIETRVPVMFGVLMCETEKQARQRSGSDSKNKGYECAKGLLQILKS